MNAMEWPPLALLFVVCSLSLALLYCCHKRRQKRSHAEKSPPKTPPFYDTTNTDDTGTNITTTADVLADKEIISTIKSNATKQSFW